MTLKINLDQEQQDERTQETQKTVLRPSTIVHGLDISVSQGAADLLAAFHLGAQTVLAILGPGQPMIRPQEHAQMAVSALQDDEPYQDVSLNDIAAMDPLRREAMLSAYGLAVATPPGQEPDITAQELNRIMEEDGIPTKPGPGGAVAKSRYEPDDEIEEEVD